MKIKPGKPIYAIFLLVPLTALFAFVLFTVRNNALHQRRELQNNQKLAGIEKTLNALEFEVEVTVDRYRAKIENLIELMPIMLRAYMENGVYTGPVIFREGNIMDGFVVQVKNGEVIYPETEEKLPDMDPEPITNEVLFSQIKLSSGWQDTDEFFISSKNIAGDYYYIDMTPASDVYTTAIRSSRIDATLND